MLLVHAGLLFVPYMLLPNWLTVYMLGRYFGARPDSAMGPAPLAGGIAMLIGALLYSAATTFAATFPFRVPVPTTPAAILLMSAAISAFYSGTAVVLFGLFTLRTWRIPAPLLFVSRHTLLIFLAHMPLYFAVAPAVLRSLGDSFVARTLLFSICLLAPAFLSVILYRVADLASLRNRVCRAMTGARSSLAKGVE